METRAERQMNGRWRAVIRHKPTQSKGRFIDQLLPGDYSREIEALDEARRFMLLLVRR